MNHALFSVACNHSRHTGIFHCMTFPDDPAKPVSAHGFNDDIHILSCCKPRPECYGQFCHILPRSEIFLCKDRIDKGDVIPLPVVHLLKLPDAFPGRINEQCRTSCPHNLFRLIQILRPVAVHILNLHFSLVNSLTECHIAPDCRWIFYLKDQHRKSAFYQFIDRTCGNITAAAHYDQISFLHTNLLTFRNRSSDMCIPHSSGIVRPRRNPQVVLHLSQHLP